MEARKTRPIVSRMILFVVFIFGIVIMTMPATVAKEGEPKYGAIH